MKNLFNSVNWKHPMTILEILQIIILSTLLIMINVGYEIYGSLLVILGFFYITLHYIAPIK